MQPETKFKNKVMPLLKAIPKSWWFKTQLVALRGIPDIIGTVNGVFVALELKVPPNKLKPGSLQELTIQQIKAAGGYACELNPLNLHQVLEDLKGFSEQVPRKNLLRDLKAMRDLKNAPPANERPQASHGANQRLKS